MRPSQRPSLRFRILPSPFARRFGIKSTSFVTVHNTVKGREKLWGSHTIIRKLSFAPRSRAALSLTIAAQFLRCYGDFRRLQRYKAYRFSIKAPPQTVVTRGFAATFLKFSVKPFWEPRKKRQCLSPAFSPQRPKSPYFARLGVFHGCRISSFDRTRCAGLWSNFLFSRTVAQRPVLGFRWVRARLCPENRTQPPHAAHAGGQVVFCRACWSASKRFRMRSCSHSVSSFASFCS